MRIGRCSLLALLVIASSAAAATPRTRPLSGSAAADSPHYFLIRDDGDGTPERVPIRVPARVRAGTSGAEPANAMAEPDTTFTWFHHSFEVAATGACDARGWTVEERSHLVFAHVDNKHLTNDGFVSMGTKALWFGTDLAANPGEVAGWYYPEGFGSGWSQRLTSPTFTNGNYRLVFDGQVGLAVASLLAVGQVNRFLAVQALRSDGKWAMLTARFVASAGPLLATAAGVRGSGTAMFHCFVPTSPDSQGGFAFATPTQIRIVLQSPSATSNEDGVLAPQPCPGAIVDNLRLEDLDGGSDPIPLEDFEDGTTGPWTLSAQNEELQGGGNAIRDGFPATTMGAAVKSGFDPIDPTCLCQLANTSGFVNDGASTRLSSPWIPTVPSGDPSFSVNYFGSIPGGGPLDGRFFNFRVRGKNAGDTHCRMYGRTPFIQYGGATSDLDNPVGPISGVITYPGSFGAVVGPLHCDSIQIVFELVDLFERFNVDPATRLPTRHPILDDIEIVQFHLDSDFDGVPDLLDLCPTVCAAGQDADGDGCPDVTETMRHVETWASTARPIHYRLSQHGDPRINDGSDLQALRDAFAAWAAVPGANVQLVEDPVTSQTDASATDGINLLTFEDDYAFPGNVLAITPTLSFTKRMSFDDQMRLPGEIVDADIMFNPAANFRTATAGPSTGFDLRSVATHEIGHLLGLSHSGVADATMYPVLQNGTLAASLESDDMSAIAAAYPGVTLATDYGSISGRLTRGSDGTPIPGSLVMGVLLDGGGAPVDTAASDYTDEDGYYHLYRLLPGDYGVRVVPLDGSIVGVVPGAINARVLESAQTNFQAEWYGGPESNSDDPDVKQAIAVVAGASPPLVNIISNIDVTPPAVVGVSPEDLSGSVRIDSPILVTFSEPVDAGTIGASFKLHTTGGSGTLGGHGQLLTPGLSFVFVPDEPLAFLTSYELQMTTALKDVQGNALSTTFTTTFTTQAQPPVSIADLSPHQAPHGALVTLTGTGYDAAQQNKVYFSTSQGFSGYVLGTMVTPTSMVVEVPADALSGPVKLDVGGNESNPFTFSLLTSAVAAPSPNGDPVAIGFAPSDVALSPDGKTAFVVGSAGFARINLDPDRPLPRQAQPTLPALTSGSRLALLPNGLRAYVTRPDQGDIVVLDADPNSGFFGQPQDTIPLPGHPEGLAISPSGQRAYVLDQASDLVREIDVDAGSLTYHLPLREIEVPGAQFSGGIAIDARRERLIIATRNLGVVSVDLDTTSLITTVSTSSGAGAVAMTPGGNLVLATSPDPNPGRLAFGDPTGAAASGSVDLGGSGRDVVAHPDGATAFVANGLLSRLQVVDVTQTTPVQVANVATGSVPVAVAVSSNGSLIATANSAAQSVSLFNVVGTATPLRVTPPVASAGDQVAVSATGGSLTSGTVVDLGAGGQAVVHAVPSAVGFAVPAGAQRTASVTLVNATVRSLSVPIQIVDPITSFDPRATGIALDPVDVSCGSGSVDGALEHVVVSPDGRLLAVSRLAPSCALVDVYQVVPGVGTPFGNRVVNGASIPGATALYDLAFTPDSHRLWVASDAGGLFELNVETGDAGLGNLLPFGTGTVGTAHALATDPMGRYVIVGAEVSVGTNQIQLWSPGRALANSVNVTDEVRSLAVTPDGHYALGGAEGRAHVVDLSAASLVTSTPVHSSAPPDLVTSIAITADGKRAAGLFPGGAIAIWNLDPLAGTVGAEQYFDTPLFGGAISQLVPAPDGHSIFAGCTDCNVLYSFRPDAASPPGNGPLPGLSPIPIGQPARALARSADGRHLWAANWNDGTLIGEVQAFTLTRGSTLSLVSGDGQSASPSQLLPLPVRVHFISEEDGHDAAGAMIRFSLSDASQGTLDGGATEVLKPTDLTGEAEVAWTLSASAAPVTMTVSAPGVPGATLAVGAEAVADPSVAAPVVVSTGPANGATGINADSPVFVRFSQGMSTGDLDSNVVLTVNGAKAGRIVSLADGGRSAFFRPKIALTYSARCSLYLPAGLHDQEGQLLAAPFSTVFTVQSAPVLEIHSLSPPSAPVGCAVTINGTGFSDVSGVNAVSFSGEASPIKTASAVSLVTTVPLDAVTGPLTVAVGAATSAPFPFTVLPATPTRLEIGVEGEVRDGIEGIAITPDSRRAYITLPAANCVLAYDLAQRAVVKSIAVGLHPQGIAITPDGHYAYVANSGSDNVSVIDINPDSPTYHTTLPAPVHPIRVGDQPSQIAISAFGPTILVMNAGDGTVSMIDAEAGRGTFDRVTSTTNTGTGGRGIVVVPDGTRAYVATGAGILVIDVQSRAVTATINIGSGGKGVTVTPDGTVLFALGENGFLNIIDISAGSTTYNHVTSSVNVGSGGKGVVVSPDGTLLYLTMQDANQVLGFRIQNGTGGGAGSGTAPGPAITLTPADTVDVGTAPGGMVMFPNNLGAMVVNEGSGTVSFLGAASVTDVEPAPAPVLELALAVNPTPSRGVAAVYYALPQRARVEMDLFDIQGRLVRQLLDAVVPAGRHSVEWRGETRHGATAGPGIYLLRLRAGTRVLNRRIVWLR